MIQKIGLYTGLVWSGSFIFTMLSLTQPGWGFAGNLLGIATIWVAGIQLRNIQDTPWSLHQRWRKSLSVHALAALLCTFVQLIYLRFIDGGTMVDSIVRLYQTPDIADAIKKSMPDFDIEQTIGLLNNITLSELMGQMLMMNAFFAILLSIPTAVVAKVRNDRTL